MVDSSQTPTRLPYRVPKPLFTILFFWVRKNRKNLPSVGLGAPRRSAPERQKFLGKKQMSSASYWGHSRCWHLLLGQAFQTSSRHYDDPHHCHVPEKVTLMAACQGGRLCTLTTSYTRHSTHAPECNPYTEGEYRTNSPVFSKAGKKECTNIIYGVLRTYGEM